MVREESLYVGDKFVSRYDEAYVVTDWAYGNMGAVRFVNINTGKEYDLSVKSVVSKENLFSLPLGFEFGVVKVNTSAKSKTQDPRLTDLDRLTLAFIEEKWDEFVEFSGGRDKVAEAINKGE